MNNTKLIYWFTVSPFTVFEMFHLGECPM